MQEEQTIDAGRRRTYLCRPTTAHGVRVTKTFERTSVAGTLQFDRRRLSVTGVSSYDSPRCGIFRDRKRRLALERGTVGFCIRQWYFLRRATYFGVVQFVRTELKAVSPDFCWFEIRISKQP